MTRERRRARHTFALVFGASVLLVGSVWFAAVRSGGPLVRLGTAVQNGCGCSVGTVIPWFGYFALAAAALVAFMIITRTAQQLVRTRRFMSTVRRIPVSSNLASAAEAAGIAGRVHEYADGCGIVFCTGLLAPRVYVPSHLVRQLGPEALRAVLEHERYHLKQRDPFRLLLIDVIRIIPGFSSLVGEFRAHVELAADEAAVDRMGNGHGLGEALLEILSQKEVRAHPAHTAVAFFDTTDRRIDQLLGIAPPPTGRRRTAFTALCIVVAFVIVGMTARFTSTAAQAAPGPAGRCILPPSCRYQMTPRDPAPPRSIPSVTLTSIVR